MARSLFAPTLVVLLLSLCSAALFQQTAPSPQAPVPDADSLKKASSLVNELFKDDLAKAKKPEDKAALAKKLVQTATETQNDPAARFVLLEMARDTATQADDVETAWSAIEWLDKTYQVDALKMKTEMLQKLAKPALPERICRAVFEKADSALGDGIAQDRYDLANQLAELAASAARVSNDDDLRKLANVRKQEVKEVEAAYAKAKDALTTLSQSPKDPEANFTAGRFYCFMKGDWQKGLPLLAVGGEVITESLAKKELDQPTTAEKQAEIGDGWWSFAEKQVGVTKRRLTEHALSWYEKALPGLTGMAKVKVERNMDAICDVLGPKLSDWSVSCWQGRWNDFPLSKMEVKRGGGCLTIKNTTGIHAFALLRHRQLLDGDFAITLEYRGNAAGFLLYDKEGSDAAIGVASLKKSNSWCQVELSRKNGEWQRRIAGKPVTAPIDPAKAKMTGYFSINILSGQEVEIRRCVVRTGEAARR